MWIDVTSESGIIGWIEVIFKFKFYRHEKCYGRLVQSYCLVIQKNKFWQSCMSKENNFWQSCMSIENNFWQSCMSPTVVWRSRSNTLDIEKSKKTGYCDRISSCVYLIIQSEKIYRSCRVIWEITSLRFWTKDGLWNFFKYNETRKKFGDQTYFKLYVM